MSYLIQTHSEYEYIQRSYEFVAHMFSAGSGYAGLIACVAIASITFGTVSFLAGQTLSGKGNILSLLLNLLLASTIMVLLVSDKSEVRIHDIPTGRWTVVGGVPSVLAVLAYAENNIEIATTDMIEAVMSPLIPYDDIGNGRGFDLLASFDEMGRSFYAQNPYAYESLANYWRECVVPDLTYGWIDQKKLYSSDDLWKSIKSETRSYTSVFVSEQAGKRVAEPKPCTDSYLLIDAQLNGAAMQKQLVDMCEKDGTNIAVNANCVRGVDGIIDKAVAIPTVDRNAVIRSYLVSWAIMSEGGQLTNMLAEVNKKNTASAFMAEKMLPRLKGMMYGMIIGIFPLLVVFIWISPGRTLIFYSGLFLMMILWNAIDTFMDMQYQSEVYNMMAVMRKRGLGLHQMFDLPNLAADAVSLYGSGRWMSLGLATAIASALTKVNSYALSQMGSQLGSSAQGTAAASAGYMDSAGQTKLAEQAGRDQASRMIANSAPIAQHAMGIANYEAFNKMTQANTGNGLAGTTGIAQAAATQAGGTTGGIAAKNALASKMNMSDHKFAEFANTGGQVTQDIANSMAQNGLVSQATANNMVGLKLDTSAMGIGADGKLSNIQATGVRNGKEWSVSEAKIEARHTLDKTTSIAGMNIADGSSVTETFDKQGNLTQLGVEKAGHARFSARVVDGNIDQSSINGTQALFDDNGKNIGTMTHRGLDKTITSTAEDGTKTTAQAVFDTHTGNIRTTSRDIVTPDGINIKQTLTKDERVSQETRTGGGYDNFSMQVDESGDITYKGSYTYTDKNGDRTTDTHNGVNMTRSYNSGTHTLEEKYNQGFIVSSTMNVGEGGTSLGGGLTATQGAVINKTMDGSATVSGVIQTQDGREFNGTAMFNTNGGLVDFKGVNGQSMTKQDVDNINQERMNTSKAGSSSETYINAEKTYGGAEVLGYNASKAVLDSGLSKHIQSDGEKDAFIQNYTGYLSSFQDRKGSERLSEQQAIEVLGKVSASTGIDIFGNGVKAEVAAALKADLSHGSSNENSVNLNRAMATAVYANLETERANGVYNNANGTFNSEKYDATAQERFGILETESRKALNEVYGPGNFVGDIGGAINDGRKYIEANAPRTPGGGGGIYKDKDGNAVGETWQHKGRGFGGD